MSFWVLEPKKLIPSVFTVTDLLNTLTFYILLVYLYMVLTKHRYLNHKLFIFILLSITISGIGYEYLNSKEEGQGQIFKNMDVDLKFD